MKIKIESLILTDAQLKLMSLIQLEEELEGINNFLYDTSLKDDDRKNIEEYIEKIKNEIDVKTKKNETDPSKFLNKSDKSFYKSYTSRVKPKKKMKLTLNELKELVREEILAEKKRKKKRKKLRAALQQIYFPKHPFPYHLPYSVGLTRDDMTNTDDNDMDLADIEIA